MRIAVVDDEAYWREQATKFIREHYGKTKIDIDVYESGRAYLESEICYDISFVDIEMPWLDGFDTISKARKYNKDGIYIILTTHTDLSRKGYLVNAFRYVDKTKLSELEEAITSAEIVLGRNEKITVNVIDVGEQELVLKNIIYIETEKHYVWIHTTHGLNCKSKCNPSDF